MAINCEILDLRAFMYVLDLGSFHRAAEALNISQPALSRRIQKLEGVVGAALLERTTRSVAATALGMELIPLVRRMLEEFDQSLFTARGSGLQRSSVVNMACIPTAAFYFLPTVIRKFAAEFPHVRFSIMDLTATGGIQAVARGEVEFGINIMGNLDPDLDFIRLIEDPFVLAVRKDHPLAEFESVTWAHLEKHPMISVHRSSANRTLLDAALARANVQLKWSYEVTHLSTSLGLVEAGLGISVLPGLATPQGDHPILKAIPIGGPEVSRTIGVVKRRNVTLSPAAERFLGMLVGTWAKD
ncbi:MULTISPECIES: LysR family transcriptional regulator [Neorhizobium]|uniref:LysR family transcriptional regulator n=1 Tax=Neorhizobium TaxID=1525371 RepID=UPI000CF87530|nr:MULTISPECIES: LysR family transcriptional regulator [Neorhizobium]